MKKLEYGEVFESSFKTVSHDFKKFVSLYGYKVGDTLDLRLEEKLFSPVIVVNDSNYLDIEYRFIFDSKIYSQEEATELQKKLK